MNFLHSLKAAQDSSLIILLFTLIFTSGFLMTRITKIAKLPHVTGYLLAGIVIGPSVLKLVDMETVQNLDAITDIAVAIIAFSVGRHFKLSKLKSNGVKSIVLTIFESSSAMLLVMVSMRYLFNLPWAFCFMLGAIGAATSSASTMMTIRQYRAKGAFVDSILQVSALDGAFSLIAFSVSAAIIKATDVGGISFVIIFKPVIVNLITIALGFGSAFILKYLIAKRNSDDHRLVVLIIIIFGLTGLCIQLDVSPLLSCMMLGGTYRNITGDKQLFRLLNFFAPPILLTFFVVSGMKLNLVSMQSAGIMGIAYFLIRMVGKYSGAFVGASVLKMDKSIRNYLGLALFPQAGVSIGLAALGQRLLPPEMGILLTTIILPSAVLYEIVGPITAKLSIVLSGSVRKVEIPQEDEVEPVI
jgi:Kef-type K+ transport system membrane component KefB